MTPDVAPQNSLTRLFIEWGVYTTSTDLVGIKHEAEQPPGEPSSTKKVVKSQSFFCGGGAEGGDFTIGGEGR